MVRPRKYCRINALEGVATTGLTGTRNRTNAILELQMSGKGVNQDFALPLTVLWLIFSREEGFHFSRIRNPKQFSRSSPHPLTFRPFAGPCLG